MRMRDPYYIAPLYRDPVFLSSLGLLIALLGGLVVLTVAAAKAHENETCVASHVETSYVPVNYGSGVVIATPFTSTVCDQWVPK